MRRTGPSIYRNGCAESERLQSERIDHVVTDSNGRREYYIHLRCDREIRDHCRESIARNHIHSDERFSHDASIGGSGTRVSDSVFKGYSGQTKLYTGNGNMFCSHFGNQMPDFGDYSGIDLSTFNNPLLPRVSPDAKHKATVQVTEMMSEEKGKTASVFAYTDGILDILNNSIDNSLQTKNNIEACKRSLKKVRNKSFTFRQRYLALLNAKAQAEMVAMKGLAQVAKCIFFPENTADVLMMGVPIVKGIKVGKKLVKAGKVIRSAFGYANPPKIVKAFPGFKPVKFMGDRKEWVNKKGVRIRWDSRHGTVEKHAKNGKHIGEFCAETGRQLKGRNPNYDL